MNVAARLAQWLDSLSRRSLGAVLRFPVAVCAIAVFSILSNIEVARGALTLERPLAGLSAGAALSVAVTLLLEARGWKWLGRTAVSGLAALLAGAATGWSEPFAVHAPMLLTAALLAVPLAPFVRRGSAQDFWVFALWTLVGVVLAFITVLVFCLGMQAILEMVRYLFRVELFPRLDRYLLTTALTFVGPLFALARVPGLDEPHAAFDADDRLVRTVRPLFEWVQAPLILAAALILHVYAARIAISGEVPRNQIGWIVATYSLLLLQLRIALDPFRTQRALAGRVLSRVWVVLLLVPLGLLGVALVERIGAEGFTLSRYLLVLWFAAVALSLLVQLPRRLRGDIRILVAIPMILLTLGTFGPWGVSETVGRSQVARIQSELGSTLLSASGMTSEQSEQLRSRLRALDEVGALERARRLFPAALVAPEVWSQTNLTVQMVMARIQPAAPPVPENARRRFHAAGTEPVDVTNYDRVFPSVGVDASPVFRLAGNGGELTIRWNGVEDRVDLVPISSGLAFEPAISGIISQRPDPPRVELVTQGGRHIAVRPERLVMEGENRFLSAEMTVLLRAEEWKP